MVQHIKPTDKHNPQNAWVCKDVNISRLAANFIIGIVLRDSMTETLYLYPTLNYSESIF